MGTWEREARTVRRLAALRGVALDEDQLLLDDVRELMALHHRLQTAPGPMAALLMRGRRRSSAPGAPRRRPHRPGHRLGRTMASLLDAAWSWHAADSATNVVLRDGRPLVIRSLVPSDRAAIAVLLTDLSPESRARRFHSAAVAITPATLDLVTAGHALVAAIGGHLVALGSYVARPETTHAELALLVADAEQGRGIGTALGVRLARDAQCAGLRQLRAEVQSSNRQMLRLLHRLGYRVTVNRAPGTVTVYVELCPAPAPARQGGARRSEPDGSVPGPCPCAPVL